MKVKCDICNEKYSSPKLKRFTRKQLIKHQTLGDDIYLNEKLKVLDKLKIDKKSGFKRKARICNGCLKDLDLNLSESVYEEDRSKFSLSDRHKRKKEKGRN